MVKGYTLFISQKENIGSRVLDYDQTHSQRITYYCVIEDFNLLITSLSEETFLQEFQQKNDCI